MEVSSAYIHIPFCTNICSYCDFCKVFYNEKLVDNYISALDNEIKSVYKNELLNTIYIGGGTPSCLSLDNLEKLFKTLAVLKRDSILEYTIECNIESIDEEKLKLFKENGINRISIGIQTLNDMHIKFLNRFHTKEMVLERINLVKKYFDNISVDLIYALPCQTTHDVLEDLRFMVNLGINHISTYSLIIEKNTVLGNKNISNIDQDLDFEMYNEICNFLEKNGYIHYEISNFSKEGYESKHNLTYWNNLEYYGFGCGASGYINNIRYENTRSITNYIKGIKTVDEHKLNKEEIIENEFILGLRKMEGINKKDFKDKYGINIKNIGSVKKLLGEGKLLENKNSVYINPNYIYTSNDILINFIN